MMRWLVLVLCLTACAAPQKTAFNPDDWVCLLKPTCTPEQMQRYLKMLGGGGSPYIPPAPMFCTTVVGVPGLFSTTGCY